MPLPVFETPLSVPSLVPADFVKVTVAPLEIALLFASRIFIARAVVVLDCTFEDAIVKVEFAADAGPGIT